MSALKVGDRLWMVERRGNRDHGSEVVVTKVGRKWTYIAAVEGGYDRGRMDEDMVLDHGQYTSTARCFRSEAEYEARLARAQAWDDLSKIVRNAYRCPAHLTINDIAEIRARISPSPVSPNGEVRS